MLSEREREVWAKARFWAAGFSVLGVASFGSLMMINSKYIFRRQPDLQITFWVAFAFVAGAIPIYRLNKREERISGALATKYFEGMNHTELETTAEYFGLQKSLIWLEMKSKQKKQAV